MAIGLGAGEATRHPIRVAPNPLPAVAALFQRETCLRSDLSEARLIAPDRVAGRAGSRAQPFTGGTWALRLKVEERA